MKVAVKAMSDLQPGAVVFPLDFKRPACMVQAGDRGLRHPHGVSAVVTYRVTGEAQRHDDDERTIEVFVNPDWKLPRGGGEGEMMVECTEGDAPYPFWGIKRQEKADEAWNCEIIRQDVMVVTAVTPAPSLKRLCADAKPAAETYTATLPCIVNTVPILASTELVLKWTLPVKQEKPKKDKDRTWVEDTGAAEKRRRNK